MNTKQSPLVHGTTPGAIPLIPAPGERESARARIRGFGSLAVSAALHAGVLLVMACWVLPVAIPGRVELTAWFRAGEADARDELLFELDAAPQLSAEFEISAPIPEPDRGLPKVDVPDREALRADLPATMQARSLRPSAAPAGKSAELPRAASSVEEAVDRITEGIRGKLQEGDLLVVWLLDASFSLVDDRQRVASRLRAFFQHVADGPESPHQLLNAVVSFGAGMKEQVGPTVSREDVVNAVRELPIDASGQENVFSAVAQCASRYRKKWRDKGLMIVVWTDESGDDVTELDGAIRTCANQAVSVSVVGPSAVLGADMGLHSFTDPGTQQVHRLPVRRGPDSALPERLDLGYWYLTREPERGAGAPDGFGGAGLPSWYGTDDLRVPGYRCLAALEVPLPSWYGGRDLKGLVSGFGPYALTRLTLQTGGTYLIFDREEDRAPFSPEVMGAYAPDYRSIEQYLDDVRSRPLRQAVMAAVKLTQQSDLGPPPTLLFGKESQSPPLGFMRTYLTPARFASHLRESRRRLKAQADRTTRVVEQALAHLSEPGSVEYGLEAEYRKEPSRRWRAWYDLTRGRLLAASVRLEEYRLTCDLVVRPGFLDETTNHLIFVPSPEMKSGAAFRRRVEEAERLLVRCVRENPNTPWALLAQRELDHGLGIDVRQHVLLHVVMPPSSGQQARLPNL